MSLTVPPAPVEPARGDGATTPVDSTPAPESAEAPPRKGRGGLIAAIVVAGIVMLGGAFGGGVALGLNLGDGQSATQGEFPGDPGGDRQFGPPGDSGDRPAPGDRDSQDDSGQDDTGQDDTGQSDTDS